MKQNGFDRKGVIEFIHSHKKRKERVAPSKRR